MDQFCRGPPCFQDADTIAALPLVLKILAALLPLTSMQGYMGHDIWKGLTRKLSDFGALASQSHTIYCKIEKGAVVMHIVLLHAKALHVQLELSQTSP
jgi:hypothetical protein